MDRLGGCEMGWVLAILSQEGEREGWWRGWVREVEWVWSGWEATKCWRWVGWAWGWWRGAVSGWLRRDEADWDLIEGEIKVGLEVGWWSDRWRWWRFDWVAVVWMRWWWISWVENWRGSGSEFSRSSSGMRMSGLGGVERLTKVLLVDSNLIGDRWL